MASRIAGTTVEIGSDTTKISSALSGVNSEIKSTQTQLKSVNTMDALSDLAKEMGSTTAFFATECAEALNYLALVGYDTQEMADTLPTVLNLAAGDIELASSSDMVTDVMPALGMETDEADTMVDQMAKTASRTNTFKEQGLDREPTAQHTAGQDQTEGGRNLMEF